MHPSTARAGSGGSSGAHRTRSAPPLYIPPTHLPADFPARLGRAAFTHYTDIENELPYRPRSRAHITLLAHLALVMLDDDWASFPALGESISRDGPPFQSVIDLIDRITRDVGPPFLPMESAFRLPPSLFAEVPILVAIYNSHDETCENVLMHFQGAHAFLRHFHGFVEKDHMRDDREIPEVIAVGANVLAAGSLSRTHPRDEVYLPADSSSNRVIWTPFWERFSDSHSYNRILDIARWNAHVYHMLAIEEGDNPRNIPNSWRLWPSVHADLSPPRWLTEHRLRAAVPHDLDSGRYAYRIVSFTCPVHGDFVVRQHYHILAPCTRKGRVRTHRRRRCAPVAHPEGPPPNRAIGCQLPEWLVALDPDTPPPSALYHLVPPCTPPPCAAACSTPSTDVAPCMRPPLDHSALIVDTNHADATHCTLPPMERSALIVHIEQHLRPLTQVHPHTRGPKMGRTKKSRPHLRTPATSTAQADELAGPASDAEAQSPGTRSSGRR